jgi:hypothetical protein
MTQEQVWELMKSGDQKMIGNDSEQVLSGLRWLGIDATPEDCDYCEDGSVYYGLTQVLPPTKSR